MFDKEISKGLVLEPVLPKIVTAIRYDFEDHGAAEFAVTLVNDGRVFLERYEVVFVAMDVHEWDACFGEWGESVDGIVLW